MPKRANDEDGDCDDDENIPLPIQTFLWRQTSPFIRPKFGKLQDATAMEQREACKSFEKVLVQNIQFGLSPSLTEAIKSITRWKLIQTALPHVMHCCAALLYHRKNNNMDKLGASETKLLYTLHWIILDAAEECIDAEREQGIHRDRDHYLLPISTIEVFIYLFAPLISYLKQTDFLTSFRLEQGYKIWDPLFEHRHPNIFSFIAKVKPKRNILKASRFDGRVTVKDKGNAKEASPIIIPKEPTPTAQQELSKSSVAPKPTAPSAPAKNDQVTSVITEEMREKAKKGAILLDPTMATYLDVAVVRSLFTSQWLEEGVIWALHFVTKRLNDIKERVDNVETQRPRSSSLPIQKDQSICFPTNGKTTNGDFLANDKLFILGSEFSSLSRQSSFQELRRSSFSGVQSDFKEKRKSKRLKKEEDNLFNEFFIDTEKSRSDREVYGSFHLKKGRSSSHELIPPPPRPRSTLGFCESGGTPKKESKWSKLKEMTRVKSMPSLHLMIDRNHDSSPKQSSKHLEVQNKSPSKKTVAHHTQSFPNPIITVTEHSPQASVQFFLNQETAESPKEDLVYPACRQLMLTRSQTDSNITYYTDTNPEASGSVNYITKSGNLSLLVILRAVHAVSLRDNVCSLSVCEGIINVTKSLVSLGLLQQFHDALDIYGNPEDITMKSQKNRFNEFEEMNVYYLFIDTVMRVHKHLGCPNHCNEGHPVTETAKVREDIQGILTNVHRANEGHFSKYFQEMVETKPLHDVIDIFHSYLGFCSDSNLCSPFNKPLRNTNITQAEHKTGYSNNFGAGFSKIGPKGIEGVIVYCIFHPFISRVMNMHKEIKTQENMSLYCDIRQLINYVKCNHGGVLRKVSLSGLIESAEYLFKRLRQPVRIMKPVETDSEPRNLFAMASPFVYPEETEKMSHRKSFFKKKGSNFGIKKVPSNQSIYEEYPTFEWSACAQGPGGIISSNNNSTPALLKIHRAASPRLSITDDDATLVVHQKSGKFGGTGRFQFVSWLKGDKSSKQNLDNLHPDSYGFPEGISPSPVPPDSYPGTEKLGRRASFQTRGAKLSHKSSSHVSLTFFKARKRMEDHFSKFVFGKVKNKQGAFEDATELSRRNSFDFEPTFRDGETICYRESKLVPLPIVRNGMLRFSFLLEACAPGSIPDAPLIAAILDIKAPIVARAAFFFECANFVHSCNRGQWPSWMKLHLPIFRPSGPLKSSTSTEIRERNYNSLHRSAGRMFYQWAEAIGAYLEQIMFNEKNLSEYNNLDETRRKQLKTEDEEEDFLDEAHIATSESNCPFALRMAACQLLLEITAFLRETHQYLPTRSSKSSLRAEKPFSNYECKAVIANRRWSMALSSLGFSQNSAHSLMSLADHPHPHHGERRISFVLHEADREGSDHSSNTTITLPGDEQGQHPEEDKKAAKRLSQSNAANVRPHLLRRATGTGSGDRHGSGSFKRRSIKLKKVADRKKQHRASTIAVDDDDENLAPTTSAVRRADSLRSRRKVSGISEKSDTSERADISGEESPGILSDDGQAPDTPSDNLAADDSEIVKNLPWLRIVIGLMHTLNYDCMHHNFCLPNCYRRQMRACSRLVKAVKKIYTDSTSSSSTEKIVKVIDEKEDALKREKRFKRIITGPSSPLRRKTSASHHLDRESHLISHSIHSSTTYLPQIDVEAGLSSTQNDLSREFLECKNKLDLQTKDEPKTLKFMKHQVNSLFHSPISTFIKGALTASPTSFVEIMTISWQLILETDQHTSSSAAVAFIISAVKCPEYASDLLNKELRHQDPAMRIKAINKFFVIWRSRYQCWPRMEDGAYLSFKVPPPMIEFTLPSPKIALPYQNVVDPPWMPQVKTKIEEVTINQEQSLQRSFVTATKTRRKVQIELVQKALQEEEDKLREERELYRISAVPIVNEAAYEPSLHRIEEHEELDDDQPVERPLTHHIQTTQAIFPSSLCTAAITIINSLNDLEVSANGSAVYEVAYKVVWHCLVEDTALFLRHIFEKLTRENQKVIFQILRRLIRFMPRLPSQAAYTLYNYLIGFVMFYVRSPVEGSQDLIGTTLSVLWLVTPSVHGLFLKDLKQVLRKEQCDATLLITANVPSTKKIIVHGPEVGGIPSQFPIHEDTQFSQILIDSLDYFSIDESEMNQYFLVDSKTNQMHNLSAFVRDFYFFKRSQYPQLSLVKMNPEKAFEKLQRQAFTLQFVELGKVLMSLSIVKSPYLAIQRVLFLHEELMKLPSFPRKALEANFNLYRGSMAKEILGMDTLHKIVWVKLIGRMLEVTSGFFAQSSDIHLFLNVINGTLILHCEDASVLRLCMAILINAAHEFKNIFSSNGFLLIMPTILRIYSNHQTNGLVCRTIQFVCKQFYIMHRKPFMLQLFGSAAPILDMDSSTNFGDASKVQPKAFFQLLQSMSQYIVDPLDILELVDVEKPLKALDFCYQMDTETFTILDAISLCVTVIAYAADSQRGEQMLTILEACLPLFMKHMQTLTLKKETPGGPRAELQMIHNLSVCMKTMISNSEALTRNFTGPQRAIDLRSSSIKNASKGACSPPYEIDDDSHSNRFMGESYYPTRTKQQNSGDEDAEAIRLDFRRPRDAILNVVAEFLTRSTSRLQDLSKKLPDLHQKGSSYELLDVKCHLRLAEIAHSLLKVAPYDPQTMACRGLVRYMNEVLPNSEWRQEAMRPALIMILRRLDKMFSKISKKTAMKRLTDWEAAKRLLKGVYSTFVKHPYIVHLPHLKSLINICQNIILGDPNSPLSDSSSAVPTWTAALSHSPPAGFCSVSVRLIAMQLLQMPESQTLEVICQGAFSSPEKTEIYLINMIYPMCIRISGGLKDVPKLRPCDVTFTLSIILNTLNPPVSKSGGKSSESSTIQSNSFLQSSLQQIGLLGLKIMMVCFERQLMTDWYRIAKCIRELANKNLGGLNLWNFLDFVVTHRTSLFILLLPLIRYKLLQKICDNEQEYYYQQLIKEKLAGRGMPSCRSKGQLLVYLLTELKNLKEDLINRKTEDKGKSPMGHGVGHRLSHAFTSLQSSVARPFAGSSATAAPQTSSPTVESEPTPPKRPTLLRGLSFRHEGKMPLRGLSVKLPTEREGGRKVLDRFVRRTSYPYNTEDDNKTGKGICSVNFFVMINEISENKKNDQEHFQSEPRLFRNKSTIHMKKRVNHENGQVDENKVTSPEALSPGKQI
ncbi:protein unc-80-like protein [Dinothrombium tinctorium]|uniref:Protein unc-80-like protein n=1 Tax=Dinothrombium tinctorium TaxID=1965070 RepID=A0A3S3PL39_9ACAR|nr:protein unc-80-like protein [Dinothrombium tinctorium]RWS14517.1 protein unc-80-like protein [Dinothrombium tinctorium]RWS17532.1 protein unc-80-like protein [Dinothrombium tinctorium]